MPIRSFFPNALNHLLAEKREAGDVFTESLRRAGYFPAPDLALWLIWAKYRIMRFTHRSHV